MYWHTPIQGGWVVLPVCSYITCLLAVMHKELIQIKAKTKTETAFQEISWIMELWNYLWWQRYASTQHHDAHLFTLLPRIRALRGSSYFKTVSQVNAAPRYLQFPLKDSAVCNVLSLRPPPPLSDAVFFYIVQRDWRGVAPADWGKWVLKEYICEQGPSIVVLLGSCRSCLGCLSRPSTK